MQPWPSNPEALIRCQTDLGAHRADLWRPPGAVRSVVACFVCWARGAAGGTENVAAAGADVAVPIAAAVAAGFPGDRGWSGAAWVVDGNLRTVATVSGGAGAAYEPGLLALREGPILEAALLALAAAALPHFDAEVLLVDATGRDHPRRAGLAVQLGARLGLPSVGVTNRALVAAGEWPPDVRGAAAPLRLEGETVAYWVRTRTGVHPVAAHAGWRTDADTALHVVLATSSSFRTPAPLRFARRAAREARTLASP